MLHSLLLCPAQPTQELVNNPIIDKQKPGFCALHLNGRNKFHFLFNKHNKIVTVFSPDSSPSPDSSTTSLVLTSLQFQTEVLFLVSVGIFAVCSQMIHPTATAFKEVNRKCPLRNTAVQLSTPYTDPEHHNTQRHRQMDRQTERQTTAH